MKACYIITIEKQKYNWAPSHWKQQIINYFNLPRSVSNPDKPLKDGVSLKRSMILAVAAAGAFGAGPPPVLRVSLPKPLNSFLALLVKFFHLSRTSWTVLFSTPNALIAAVMSAQISFFLWLVTESVKWDLITERLSSTFSVKRAISEWEKFAFLAFFTASLS